MVIVLGLSVSSCFFSAKPLYNDQEQGVAERAVSQFHELYNQGRFEAIYDLMDKATTAAQSKDQLVENFKGTRSTLGKLQNSELVEKKVFLSPGPGYTSQVKLAYDIKTENGEWTELFAWNIKDSSIALLVEYKVVPKTDHSESPK